MMLFMSRKAYIADGIGERIRRLRKERGWTQTEFAERIGCSQRSITYYEREGKYPPAPILAAMAGAFRIDIETLMDPDEPKKKAKTDDPDLLNPEERRLWKRFRQLQMLPERDQRAVLRMLDAMSS
jgi:transcriptional regulator with XRE-family HTH domain